MLNKKILMLTMVLVSLLAISAASAAENTTGDIADVASEDVVSASDLNANDKVTINDDSNDIMIVSDDNYVNVNEKGTFTDLQKMIDEASSGSTISLEKDYVYDDGFDTDGIIISKDITIEGNGYMFDALNKSRIFKIQNCSIILDNIGFCNGNTDVYGGAIFFTEWDSDGNEIQENFNVSIINCTFINNIALCAGAISCECNLKYCVDLENCVFINNSAGLISAIVGCNNVVNCDFVNNSADDGWGAISECGSVVNCSFVNNNVLNSYGRGGAISECGSVVNCSFINNYANYEGGAISECGSVVNCSFVNNYANYEGGAISECSSVVNCSFVNNSATGDYYASGGAIYDCSSVVNCSFVNNSANWCGGAINWNYVSDSSSVVNCIFVNNSANIGGAIDLACDVDYVVNCVFVNNSAETGGAMSGGSARGCTFVNNSAVNNGGAMSGGSARGCVFVNNSAVNNGGAIYHVNAQNCSIVNNSAKLGGIIYIIGFEASALSISADFSGVTNFKIIDCNIQEDAFNNYGSIEYDGTKLIVSTDSIEDNVVVNISGKVYVPYICEQSNPKYIYKLYFNISDLSPGIYDAKISYLGYYNEENPEKSYYAFDYIVPIKIPLTTNISASDVTKYCGGSEKCTVNLTENNKPLVNADVKITVNGKTSTVKTDSKGQATIDLNLPVGEYDVTSVYEGVSTTSKVTVKSTIATADATGTYLNSKVSATFLDVDGKALASKQVTFKVGDKTYTATTNSKGVAIANIDLGTGTYTVTAINPVNNEQKQFKLVIDKANSAISLASSQNNGVTTLTATLTPAAATGNVVFNVNGEDKSAAIKNGKATLTLSDLEPGDYAVTASYNGDKNLNASTSNTVTFNVAEVYPILTADPVTKTYGTSTKLVVNLVDSKGNAIANADVSVVMGSATTHIKTDADGQATMSINKAPGTYTATITYADAQTTAKITVKKATTKITAKAKTFKKSVKTKKYTITLKTSKNKAISKAKVTLKVNGKTYKATTNTKGQATFKITKLTKKGKFTAVVKYAGSKYYNAKTAKPKITVK